MKQAFVILGMTRSDTCVMARGLKALGIHFDENVATGPIWRPHGFSNRDAIGRINSRILATLQSSWDDLSLIPDEKYNNESLAAIKEEGIKHLNQCFALNEYWGFKDLQIIKLISFWQSIFKAIGAEDYYIISLRNPLSIAQSYQKALHVDIEHGLLLWLLQFLTTIEKTKDKKTLIVSYDLMLQDPRRQLERVKKQFALPELTDSTELDTYIYEFIDTSLHHYEYSRTDLQSHPATPIAPFCLNLFDLLLRAAKDEIALNAAEFSSALVDIQKDIQHLMPIYNYIDDLLHRSYSLQKSITALQKTRLWKLISPLRRVDDALRQRRKRIKQKKIEKENNARQREFNA